MTAEKIKKEQINRQKKPTELQQKIIDTTNAHPSLNKNEIAAVVGCDHAHVVRTLQTYGIVKEELDNYVSNRASVLAGLQHKLVKSITDDDIKKAPIGSRILAACQLYDKERLERGQSTENIAHLHADIAKIRELDKTVDSSDDQTVDN